MTAAMLCASGWMHGFVFWGIHLPACIFLILIVLAQPDRGDGMAGAFGGMGGSVAFGVKTLNVVWKATVVFATLFMATALGLTYLDKSRNAVVPAPTIETPAPASAPAAPPATPKP